MQGLKSVPYSGMASAASGLAALAPDQPQGAAKTDTFYRPYEFAWNPNTEAYEPKPSPGAGSYERRYFGPTFTALPIQRAAGGGLMEMNAGGIPQDFPSGGEFGIDAFAKGGRAKSRSLTGDDLYSFAEDRRDKSVLESAESNFAAGGLGAAKESLPPTFLSGGGDGMSDSIKARIDGKQEARLADGEFIVPADVVSHLGNGSSKAGAKKLYAMMDKIRKARTGKKSQAPAVNAAKYMPA
jgi:hypothetical protein